MSGGSGVWIQGAGEMASGVALALVRAGYAVVMAEIARPLAVRRLVCFSESVYAGSVTVAGVPARLVAPPAADYGRDWVPVLVDPRASQMVRLRPCAVIDGRMTKRTPESLPLAGAPLIGLGPGFVAGRNADLVIETHRAATPGRVIASGGAAPDTGIPGEVGGQTRARLLRAPAAGRLAPRCRIGDLVRQGQVVATVDGLPVISAVAGRVRGLIHPEVELYRGMKVGDVDPRGMAADPAEVTDKALAIGAGVLQAMRELGLAPRER